MTDEQNAKVQAALKRERRGYVQRLKAAKKVGDAEEAERLTKRIADVDAALGDKHLCDECGFEAKNAVGLAVHQRSHEDSEEE